MSAASHSKVGLLTLHPWPQPASRLQEVPDGQRGLLLARGPGIMAGYYNDPGATAKVRIACCCRGCARSSLPPGQPSVASAAPDAVLVLVLSCQQALMTCPPRLGSGCSKLHLAPLRRTAGLEQQPISPPPLPKKTQAFHAGDGWFDTGDLGWRAPAGVAGSAMAGTTVLTGALRPAAACAALQPACLHALRPRPP